MTIAPSEPVTANTEAEDGKAHAGGAGREMFELGKTIFYALLIALVLRVVLLQPFTIPSASMEPTLLEGDYIIVSKFAYGWSRHSIPFSPPLPHGRLFGREPHRGDIVVFKLPRDGRTDYIKRLVGLPGDRMQVLHGVLQINGKPVQDRLIGSALDEGSFGEARPVQQFQETLPNGKRFTINSAGPAAQAANTGVYVVPKGCYFMMGDNRDNSLDSRFDPGEVAPGEASCPWNRDLDRSISYDQGVGFVPAEDLVGKADMILFSWKTGPDGASLFKPWTWFTAARVGRFFHTLQ